MASPIARLGSPRHDMVSMEEGAEVVRTSRKVRRQRAWSFVHPNEQHKLSIKNKASGLLSSSMIITSGMSATLVSVLLISSVITCAQGISLGESTETEDDDVQSTFSLRKLQGSSGAPTISTTDIPTYSPTLTPPTRSPAYVCNADPENCGCPDVYQADYRGTVNTTYNGNPCVMWNNVNLNKWWKTKVNMDGLDLAETYPLTGIGGAHNYCRNPDNKTYGAWCFVEVQVNEYGGSWVAEYCPVPSCDYPPTYSPTESAIPSTSSSPTVSNLPSSHPVTTSPSMLMISSTTSSLSPTSTCRIADKSTCGCNNTQKSDYRGTINTTNEGTACARWDADWMSFDGEAYQENYCRHPLTSLNDTEGPGCYTSVNIFGNDGLPKFSRCNIPACDPCKCTLTCEQPNLSKCSCPSVLQAEECCTSGDDPLCKCRYLKDACRISLENGGTDFCDDAEVVCCSDTTDPSCKCTLYEDVCFDFPNKFTCELAATSCCDEPTKGSILDVVTETCYCDFYTAIQTIKGYVSEHRIGNCTNATDIDVGVNPIEEEGKQLTNMYKSMGGADWSREKGWNDGMTPHCDWYGIVCNKNRRVTEISLRGNNVVGPGWYVFYHLLGDFTELKVLDLANNTLTGTLPSNFGQAFLKLERMDLSGNSIAGHADLLFPVSMSYVNLSHNQFTSAGFKRFNAAYETLEAVDLSNNNISQVAMNIFHNIPPNLHELILSNNVINGRLPDAFKFEKLTHFAMANNRINGYLPDFPNDVPLLRELDLSNQKGVANVDGLSGTISSDVFKLVDLHALNLAGNSLTGEIPRSIGNLDNLKLLNLSSNKLTKEIPSELGRLIGTYLLKIIDSLFLLWQSYL